MFEGLFRQFVSGQVISLLMGNCCGSMGMFRQVVKFRDSIVRTLWHGVLLAGSMQTNGDSRSEDFATKMS